jgi:hypothetical protein
MTRIAIWLGLPVFVLCLAVLYAILMNWSQGVPFCESWLRGALPYCR